MPIPRPEAPTRDLDYESFSIRPITPHIGAEIRGIDLASPLSEGPASYRPPPPLHAASALFSRHREKSAGAACTSRADGTGRGERGSWTSRGPPDGSRSEATNR